MKFFDNLGFGRKDRRDEVMEPNISDKREGDGKSFNYVALIIVLTLIVLIPALLLRGETSPLADDGNGNKVVTSSTTPGAQEISYTQFWQMIDRKEIRRVYVNGINIDLVDIHGRKYHLTAPLNQEVLNEIARKDIDLSFYSGGSEESTAALKKFFLFMILTCAAIFWLAKRSDKRAEKAKSAPSARSLGEREGVQSSITFDDVAGYEETKDELRDIVEFLVHTEEYAMQGISVPKGILLMGPPGTGKTLFARAVAGEAQVPFFSYSGSDFVEMYVGVGAKRVRELFTKAREKAPCIIFIDEIDAIGRSRGWGTENVEREATLNQLLVEMDGFDVTKGIVLLGATNRADILDKALLRPGRFDRHIMVGLPGQVERLAILEVHSRKKKFDESVDLTVIAKQTSGFAGADLANIINEAAILSLRNRQKAIGQKNLEDALERVIAGPEKKNAAISPEDRNIIAWHEAGHALVAALMPHADPVHKISILPRGRGALGYTIQLPNKEKLLATKEGLKDQICVLLAGRVSEELYCNDITSGAQNDLVRANQIARQMVTEFGMSDRFGLLTACTSTDNACESHSDETVNAIDQEIRAIMKESYDNVRSILQNNRQPLGTLVEHLLESEVLDRDEFMEILRNSNLQRIEMPST